MVDHHVNVHAQLVVVLRVHVHGMVVRHASVRDCHASDRGRHVNVRDLHVSVHDPRVSVSVSGIGLALGRDRDKVDRRDCDRAGGRRNEKQRRAMAGRE